MFGIIADHLFTLDAIQNLYILKKPDSQRIFNEDKQHKHKLSRKMIKTKLK